MQQERQKAETTIGNVESKKLDNSPTFINAAGEKIFTEKEKCNSKLCTYCGKIGNTINICYRKYGFPPKPTIGNFSTNACGQQDNEKIDDEDFEQSDNTKD